ncbi:MAG: riboflavin biosynthesis protein RibF [Clostridia bacterium]|nr:riboflavin biosynthesis protein RibF [Clostridia bacterium]
MEIVNLKHPEKPFPAVPSALCLGHFDGVHQGHRALIRELKQINAGLRPRLPLGALCFTEPPALALGQTPPPQLTTLHEKLRLLGEAGLDFAILYRFSDIKDLAPREFVEKILIEECRCRVAVCGFNYSFGKGGAGTAKDLAAWMGEHGLTASIVEPVTDGIHTVSSSLIRSMLERGHPEDAARLMGHPYTLTGKVRAGKHLGRVMGFPTANLYFPGLSLVPARGVYAVRVHLGRRTYAGISNVGIRPTFADGKHVTCETFLFDFNGDLYRRELRISFLHFLRPEIRFRSIEALEKQIRLDIEHAKAYF